MAHRVIARRPGHSVVFEAHQKAYPIEQFAAAMREIKDRTVRGRVVLTMR